jgi:hypothetical protein
MAKRKQKHKTKTDKKTQKINKTNDNPQNNTQNTKNRVTRELSCETSYPIAEGITGAFSTILDSMFGVLFLFILQIPHIGNVQSLNNIIIIKTKVLPPPQVYY